MIFFRACPVRPPQPEMPSSDGSAFPPGCIGTTAMVQEDRPQKKPPGPTPSPGPTHFPRADSFSPCRLIFPVPTPCPPPLPAAPTGKRGHAQSSPPPLPGRLRRRPDFIAPRPRPHAAPALRSRHALVPFLRSARARLLVPRLSASPRPPASPRLIPSPASAGPRVRILSAFRPLPLRLPRPLPEARRTPLPHFPPRPGFRPFGTSFFFAAFVHSSPNGAPRPRP